MLGRPVRYSNSKDSMSMKNIHQRVYDGKKGKKHKLELHVPTTHYEGPEEKQPSPIFFIKWIPAGTVVHFACEHKVPIYTVNDQFLTTAIHASNLPYIY